MTFAASARSKGWMDTEAIMDEGNKVVQIPTQHNITHNFMAQCGLEALGKIQHIVAPKVL